MVSGMVSMHGHVGSIEIGCMDECGEELRGEVGSMMHGGTKYELSRRKRRLCMVWQ